MFKQFLTKLPLKLCGTTANFYPAFRRKIGKFENNNDFGVNYEHGFTEEQQRFLLNVLNNSDTEHLQRYNLSKNRSKKLEAWKKKNGLFQTLTDVLDVDGLGVKMLDKLCKTILEADRKAENEEVTEKPVKARGQILTPALSANKLNEMHTALGIHFYANGISWARIGKENNNLTHWSFSDYNSNTKKLMPNDALQIILEVSDDLPLSDLYILEAPVAVTPTAQQSPVSVQAYAQRVQLLSMLMTVLSTSATHNPAYANTHTETGEKNDRLINTEPNVYFLRHRVPARLFKTLIGNERVSSAATLSKILDNPHPEKPRPYTPLSVNEELREAYTSALPVNKEVMGQALLLAMAFMDLCIYQNTRSIKAISSYKN